MRKSLIAAAFTALMMWVQLVSSHATPSRPNVILIFADDLGINDVGSYTYPSTASPYPSSGPAPVDISSYAPAAAPNSAWDTVNGVSRTPNIDGIGAAGIRMTSFYSASPVCSPTRASIMTGSYPLRVGINHVYFPNSSKGLNPSEITLPELLKARGYATLAAGKWHLGDHPDLVPSRHGFDRFHGILYSNDMWLANPGRTWPDMNYMDGDSPASTITTGTGGTIANPIDTNAEQSYMLEAMTEQVTAFMAEKVAAEQPFFVYFASHAPHTPCFPHPDYTGSTGLGNYFDVVAELDARVGQILSQVDTLNIENETLVILTSDNGPWVSRYDNARRQLDENAAGSPYPYRGFKHETWEGGQRVPFLARFPGVIPAGTTSDEVGASFDLYSTIALWAGAELPGDGRVIDGGDLRPILTDQPGAVSPHDFFVYYDSGSSTPDAILDDDWKLRKGKLYDLTNDIQESSDITSEPTRESDMQTRMDTFDSALKANDRSEGSGRSVAIELSTNTLSVPEGSTGSISVRLSASVTTTVTVSALMGDGDLSVLSGQFLSFNSSNWGDWQLVTFAASPDGDSEDGGAIFRANSSATNVREIFVLESDDQAPGLLVTQSGGATAVAEGGPSDSVTVRLSIKPADSVTVAMAPGGSLLVNGSAIPEDLTFSTSNWDQEQTVTIAAVDDYRENGNRQASLVFSSTSNDEGYDAALPAQLQVMVADNDADPSSPAGGAWADDLVLWLKDPAQNYAGGNWVDASGLGHDVADVIVGGGYGGGSSVVSVTPSSGPLSGQTLQVIQIANNGLMGNTDLRPVGGSFQDVTILAIYQADAAPAGVLSEVRPLGFGSYTFSGPGEANFQMAADASLRYDNGNNLGTESNHGSHLLIRASRLDSGIVTDWFHNGSSLVTNIAATGTPSTGDIPNPTSNDRFFLGELRNLAGGIDPTSGTTRFAQVAVFNAALTDQEVSSLVTWMLANPQAPARAPSEVWRQAFFGTTSNSGNAADSSDADGDGEPNLGERGTGTSPVSAGERRSPVSEVVRIEGHDYLQIRYHRLRGGSGSTGINYSAHGLIYAVEVSETMAPGSWQSGAAEVIAVGDPQPAADGLTEIVTVRALRSIGTGAGQSPRQFMRLRISAP